MSLTNKKPETVFDLLSKIKFSWYENLIATDEECYNLSQKKWKDGKFFFNYNIDEIKHSRLLENSFIYNIVTLYLNNEISNEEYEKNEGKGKIKQGEIKQGEIIKRLNQDIDLVISWFDVKQNENYIIYIIGSFFSDELSNFLNNIDKAKGVVTQSSGLYRCRKCSSDNTVSISFQMRSGDEGTSALCSCYNCGNRWTEHG